MIHFWVTLITFYLVFNVFRSDNWLIHVSWVIHYLIININCVDFCGGLHCRTQLLIWSPEQVSSINHHILARENAQNPKSNTSFKLPDFLLFGEVCVCEKDVEHLISITLQCPLHTTSLFLSLHPSLSRSSACCLPIDITHPKRNNTVSSPALTMMHELDGKHFSGVVIIKPFFP